MNVEITKISPPKLDNSGVPVILNDETFKERKNKVLNLMKESGFSSLIIYADKEHGSNFEYLTGFIPRFEEGLFIINQNGDSTLVLGNENYNKVKYSRTFSKGIHCPLFSLPNQPMEKFTSIDYYLKKADIDSTKNVGIVGWKLLSNEYNNFHQAFDIPYFIVDGLSKIIDTDKLLSATQIFIHPKKGARITNNSNELAHYEFGASLASDALLSAMDALVEGVTETEVGDFLNKDGQYQNVVTIAAFGKRFVNANLYPTNQKLFKNQQVSLTVGYKGGLSSRSGYAVENEEELKSIDPGYLENVVKPYYEAYNWWLSNLVIGKKGSDFFNEFSDFYPPALYGWELCPGHYSADEEWLSSPFYKESEAIIQSGSIFQIDFIPIQKKHHGISAESTVAIADEFLINEIQVNYPELWSRIEKRRDYIQNTLNLDLSSNILPLASTVGYYRPFFLDKDEALIISKK